MHIYQENHSCPFYNYITCVKVCDYAVESYNYYVIGSAYKMITIYCFIFTTVNLPVIISNPKSTLVNLKSNFTHVSFTCEADEASSHYWERQHGSIPPDATGVNTSNLTIVNLELKDAGYYRCVAVNSSGSTESKYAKLTFTGMHACMYILVLCTFTE